MPRQIRGRSIHVSVLAATPTPSDPGTPTLGLADTTASFGRVRPETVALFVELTGTGTIELALWARVKTQDDGDLGWSLLYDTGNPGLVGGGPLPAPGAYTFLVTAAMVFEAVALVKQSVTVDADVAKAVLIEYAEHVLGR